MDAFDAMTHDRPYRTARDVEVARQELAKGKGTQFDPEVVDVFLRVLEKGRVGQSESNLTPYLKLPRCPGLKPRV